MSEGHQFIFIAPAYRTILNLLACATFRLPVIILPIRLYLQVGLNSPNALSLIELLS